jgi:hypothetical protein
MGYGSLEGVQALRNANVSITQTPGLRCGILIIDERGWIFTPTAYYLEQEPQSDETPNAVELSPAQVSALAIRLSPAAKQEAILQAATTEERLAIDEIRNELGGSPVEDNQFLDVKHAVETAPPVKFDVVRQVRVFEPYLQYVELTLSGAAIQRHRVRIPKSLQNLGASKDLEGKLNTTFDLIGRGSSLSSKVLEDDLNELRKSFTPSLGKEHGRVVLKSAKPRLVKRIVELRGKLATHQETVKSELQSQIDAAKEQIVDYYLPLAKENPPDALLGGLFKTVPDESDIRAWIEEEISKVLPQAEELISNMTLVERYKDVTFETLNQPDFLECLQQAFPRINWEKAYTEFKAAGESKPPSIRPET